jgi:hypothetical protein
MSLNTLDPHNLPKVVVGEMFVWGILLLLTHDHKLLRHTWIYVLIFVILSVRPSVRPSIHLSIGCRYIPIRTVLCTIGLHDYFNTPTC